MSGVGRQGRQAAQFRVGLVVAGQEGYRYSRLAAGTGDLVNAVAPVAATTEQAHDHQPGFGDNRIGIEIDRHVVAEVHQIGEAQIRIGVERRTGIGKQRELGVGGAEENDVARRLSEIDRLRSVVDGTGLGGQKVHQPPISLGESL